MTAQCTATVGTGKRQGQRCTKPPRVAGDGLCFVHGAIEDEGAEAVIQYVAAETQCHCPCHDGQPTWHNEQEPT